jgi:hypothetical protein
MARSWWVYLNQTNKAGVGGGYTWSPKTNRNGGLSQFYQNVTEGRPGDLVFSFEGAFIRAVSAVEASAWSAEKGRRGVGCSRLVGTR